MRPRKTEREGAAGLGGGLRGAEVGSYERRRMGASGMCNDRTRRERGRSPRGMSAEPRPAQAMRVPSGNGPWP